MKKLVLILLLIATASPVWGLNFSAIISEYDFATAGDYPASSNTMMAPDTAKTYFDTVYAISGGAFHDGFSDFVANEHIDWTTDQGATNIHSGNYTDTNTTYSAGTGLTLTGTEFSLTNTPLYSTDFGTGVGKVLEGDTTPADIGAEPAITTLPHEKGGLEADVSAYDGVLKITGGSTGYIKYNFGTSAAPTVDNDIDQGYSKFSPWIQTGATSVLWTCLDNTDGAAVWSQGGGDAGKSYGNVTGTQSFTVAQMTNYIWNNYSQTATATYSFATTGFTGKEGIVFKFGTTENTTFDTIIDNAYINGEPASSTVTATSPPIGSEIFIDTLQTGESSWIWNFHCDPGLLVAD